MRAHLVVVPSPALDHDLGLAQAVEDLAVEQLVAEPGVEALDEAVLPGAARGDVGGLGTHRRDPCLDRLGHELRSVVGADVARHTAQDEEIGQDIDHVHGLELAGDPDRQALVRELVDDVEHAVLPSVVGAVLDEVVGPDVVRALGSEPDAGSVRQPEPPALGLLPRDLKPFPPPEPLDTLAVDPPTGLAQQRRDPAIAVAAVPSGERDDVGGQRHLVVGRARRLALRGAVLAENPAGSSLGHAELGDNMLHAGAAASRAQKFPRAASARIILSSVRSDTARRSRMFSASSSLKRLIWSPFSPVSSVPPIARTASATGRPCAVSTSTCRSLLTISSPVCRFLA